MKDRQGVYIVHAKAPPGPKWQPVSEPLEWVAALKALQAQWRAGRLARLVQQQ